MIKINCIVLLFILLCKVSFGLDISLKAGLNQTSFSTVESIGKSETTIGGGLDFSLTPKMSLGIELLKSQRTSVIENKIIGGWPVESVETSDLYSSILFWQIPVLLKYNVYQKGNFHFQAYGGMNLSIAKKDDSYRFNKEFIEDIGDDINWEHTYYDYEYVYERMAVLFNSGFGYCFGLSARWSMLFIELRYLKDRYNLGDLNGGAKPYNGFFNVYNLTEKMHSFYILAGMTYNLK